jgi:hypothetical protein
MSNGRSKSFSETAKTKQSVRFITLKSFPLFSRCSSSYMLLSFTLFFSSQQMLLSLAVSILESAPPPLSSFLPPGHFKGAVLAV